MFISTLDTAHRETIRDIGQATLPHRWQRSFPRVVRRNTDGNSNVEGIHHQIVKYDSATDIVIFLPL